MTTMLSQLGGWGGGSLREATMRSHAPNNSQKFMTRVETSVLVIVGPICGGNAGR
jgi:hypothetical protein